MNLIFDTHAHYDDEAFDADHEALLAMNSRMSSVRSAAGASETRGADDDV